MLKELRQFFSLREGNGKLHIFGNKGVNPGDSVEEAATKAAQLNTTESLERIVTQQENLYSQSLDGFTYTVTVPTAQYTPGATMFMLHKTDGFEEIRKAPQYVADLPTQERQRYWEHILAGLYAYQEVIPLIEKNPENHTHLEPIYVENVVPTTASHRTSRTLNVIHGQWILNNHRWVTPHDQAGSAHLQREQHKTLSLLTRSPGPLDELSSYLEKSGDLTHQVEIYTQPTGYAFSFTLDQDRQLLTNQIEKTMLAHWEWYKKHVEEESHKANLAVITHPTIKRRSVIPGPSYRQLVRIIDNRLHIIISPEFDSHAGPMEAMGVELLRTPEGEAFLSASEAAAFKEQLSKSYAATIPTWIN